MKANEILLKPLLLLSFFVIVTNAVYYFVLDGYFKKQALYYLDDNLKDNIDKFEFIYENNKRLSAFIFENDINTWEVKELVAKGKREDLYLLLLNNYNRYIEMFQIRQVHFHTKDNHSFLRMHRPQKFGDDLSDFRKTVVWTNANLQPFDGFEEGRIFNGFRYIYPILSEEKEHLGSVEVSFEGSSFIKSFIETFDTKRVNMLIKADVVDGLVFDNEHSNYIASPIEGYYFDKEVLEFLQEYEHPVVAGQKSEKEFAILAKKIEMQKPFWHHYESVSEIVYVIPLVNNLTGELVGSFHITVDDSFVQALQNEKMLYFLIFLITSTLIATVIYFDKVAKMRRERLLEIAKIERDKAKKISKYKSEFLANMSHEIRTPLNAILGFVELLLEKVNGNEEKKYLQTIHNSSKHLLGVIDDILDLSKIEHGKIEITHNSFDAKAEFDTIYQLFCAKVSEKNIDLVLQIDPSMPQNLIGDSLRIKQVVANLLSNAIKFTPQNKKIYLTIDYKQGQLCISVKDQGIGIQEEQKEKIFESFQQADSSTTREYGGTGLGLSISKTLVELMGGKLELQSEYGKGSEFYFALPLQKADTIQKTQNSSLNSDFKGFRVLLVEDNRSNQLFMKVLLKKYNLSFDIANDGLEAVQMSEKNRYDLILMDENMPNMNGTKATQAIRQRGDTTAIVALTANAVKGDRQKFIDAGMDEYLTKPVDRQKLLQVFNRFLTPKVTQ